MLGSTDAAQEVRAYLVAVFVVAGSGRQARFPRLHHNRGASAAEDAPVVNTASVAVHRARGFCDRERFIACCGQFKMWGGARPHGASRSLAERSFAAIDGESSLR
ncbi:uncharacterized protein M421DRAFT_273108 [Didymella exigua CBS 183.55]|uniref:Uncharacterized protein n=1 Tax=Didymella exigua CBS 183.55 TaxID=1150837 RepID=A0A6A5RC48_9PLEO|nr:uncharacterized protein M421DRAFT_273108 [Didymella exigua CBS 183.55]KAF1924644.1 hypothetical protein M421DRAFT_273108 [Didymella exigua CBS 183.55]